MTLLLAEHFISINGEGQHAGKPALFLRFPGCNLRCSYCDTQWANKAGCPTKALAWKNLVAQLQEAALHHVTVTGGEPLLQPQMDKLLARLSALPELAVEVETNGSVLLAPFLAAAPNVCFTMDYKLSGSGMEAQMCHENLPLLRAQDCLKLVCATQEDLQRAKQLIEQYQLEARTQVFFSPVFAEISAEDIVHFLIANKITRSRVQLQLHKYIWPPEQRGV